jgi:ATPase subunit of ABC transporter with duplicated ATPase domains
MGRNGSGKSTLLRIAAGLVRADTGGRFAQPGATIQYLPQEPDLRWNRNYSNASANTASVSILQSAGRRRPQQEFWR